MMISFGRLCRTAARAGPRALASVADITVKLMHTPAGARPGRLVAWPFDYRFIDHEGSRVTVPGRLGMTIAQVAELHGIDIGPTSCGGPIEKVHNEVWTEALYGLGPCLGYDHIQIPKRWRDIIPPMQHDEEDLLNVYWDIEDINASSRLATFVTMTPELDGIQVFIPDGIPTEGMH